MKTLLPFLSVCAAASPVQALVLMLDFGPTAPTGTGLDNSPYHTVNPGFTDTIWNPIGTADVAAGSLVYSDNSSASLIGVSSGFAISSTTISLSSTPGGSIPGGAAYDSGVYAGTSPPGKDTIFNGTANSNLGVQVTGLAAGIYEVFIHSRNTNSSQTYSQTNFVGTGTSTTSFDYASYASETLSYTASTSTGSWVEEGGTGENYTRFLVTIGTGEALNIGIEGVGDNGRGFLNSIQIALIPEPSSAIMAITALIPLTLRRKRH